jgi:hypothetical protein
LIYLIAALLRGVFKWAVLVSIVAVVLTLTVWSPGPNVESTRQAARTEPTAAPTATPEPTKTPAELADEAKYFDPQLLTSNAEGHIGENIFVQGEAQSVEQQGDYTWISIFAGVRDRPITESVVVELRPPEPDLLSAECDRFYAVIAGKTEARLVLTGATDDRPLVKAYAFEPSSRSDSSCRVP